MTQPQGDTKIHSSSITDRGLSEKRPLNEDSYLADSERHIFAVADGVGGAEAGEVASQTAIEVLDEAFRHQLEGADIEDLMELAIQRANASIHRMSREHAKFSMMATTIVALHLDGDKATIGHVGDSRLYRLTPEGQLIRETEDHSIVEEEVRAGRMTPEQAAHHPNKNVISRALGAEETVEVDLKTIPVQEGTCFLLCSDGITRHIPDNELRGLLIHESNLDSLCEELKRRCYDRGAEDNLTAVLVRIGEPVNFTGKFDDPTIEELPGAPAPQAADRPYVGNLDVTEDALVPASRIAFPASSPSTSTNAPAQPLNIPAERESGGSSGRIFLLLLFIVAVGGAFYAGARYRDRLPPGLAGKLKIPPPQTAQATAVKEEDWMRFETARREVDKAPADWLKTVSPAEMGRQKISNAIDSNEPDFVYLYGRASLLSGNTDEAAKAFERAIVLAGAANGSDSSLIRKEASLGLAAASLKSNKDTPRAVTHLDEIAKPTNTNSP